MTSVDLSREGGHVIEMQRRRLLLAIGELLGEGGVELATVGRISKRAGVSRRTFYEVFEDREECFLAALDQAIERMSEEVLPAYERELCWSARIRSGLTALLEHLDANPRVARMCVVETLRAGPEALERRTRVLRALAAAVDEGSAESKPADGPLPLTGEGVVGGVLSVIHTRLIEDIPRPLLELVNRLTGMIVQPYLGAVAARYELERQAPCVSGMATEVAEDPFKDLTIRFTYRTARVLGTVASESGASNRLIADISGVTDDGQMSRLLSRLQRAGLIENRGSGHAKGESNAWWLTERGEAIHRALSGEKTRALGRTRATPIAR